ncbi:MAG: OmpH family outer membrane protein [Bacteroidales bacterium]|nr:OmpH family outer membrane protein [Bacteroidales bacterium]MCF8404417.1 OmpH family outer membrane protein [Bacteroidales bacterium]
MKKMILSFTFLIFFSTILSAQKYAYVDTEYILDNIPEYKEAQVQLDDLAKKYQEEIEKSYANLKGLYKNYEAEAILMPEDVKQRKQEDLKKKEMEVKDLQNKYFGVEGELFDKREELVKPIQEKIFNSIEEIAEEKNYAFVFDKAGSLTILYVNAKFDISDDVLDAVGAELGTVRREDRVRKEYQQSPSTSTSKPPDSKETNRSISSPPSGPGAVRPGGSVKGGAKTERK